MPKYAFECHECNLRFERNLKVGDHSTHKCPSCEDDVPLVMSGFGFSFEEGGSSPANSGVHGHDYPTADQAVGRSASARWQHLEERKKVKEKVRQGGGTHALIRQTGKDYIDYTAMSKEGLQARKGLVKDALKVTKPKD